MVGKSGHLLGMWKTQDMVFVNRLRGERRGLVQVRKTGYSGVRKVRKVEEEDNQRQGNNMTGKSFILMSLVFFAYFIS